MRKEDIIRSKWLHIRLTPDEFTAINNDYLKTRCRKRCEYIRKLLMAKPVVYTYRDKSMDEVLEELVILRKELNLIGNNFNQVVRKLNSVSGMPDAQMWEATLTVLRDELQPEIGKIKERLNQYSEIWSQKLSAGKV